MRALVFGLVALLASACGPAENNATSASGCSHSATQQVAWTDPDNPDVISARSEGPTCAQSVVTLVVRSADGDPLWAFASTYYEMTAGGVPPQGAPPVADADIERFLASWADVTEMRSRQLPEWREAAATLSESAETFAYETPFERDVYEMLRQRDLPMICYAAAAEASQCLIVDPASATPIMIVAYGP